MAPAEARRHAGIHAHDDLLREEPARGEPRHYTFTDEHVHGFGYRWWPPSAQGYCTNTLGQKPQAACKNIGSLP
jgi:hypothetical protein